MRWEPVPSWARRAIRPAAANQVIAEEQVIELTLHERPDRIGRRTDDRLLVHVEAGVDEDRKTGELPVLLQDPVVLGILVPADQLRPCRSVDVHHRGAALVEPRRTGERDRHELRGGPAAAVPFRRRAQPRGSARGATAYRRT